LKFTKMLEKRKADAAAKRQQEQAQQQQAQETEAQERPARTFLKMVLEAAIRDMQESEAVPLQIRPMVSALIPMIQAGSSRLTEAQAQALIRGVVEISETKLKPLLAVIDASQMVALEAQATGDESRAIN
jgi:Mg2+/Co2+ transporter CorC